MNAQPEETQFRPEGPQPLLREIAPGMAYPVQALGPLREAVEAVQGMTQAPVAIPAQSALAVASLAVMAFADVETLGGNRPLSLYALTIAQSGERKSACYEPFLTALRAFEREQAVQQRAAVQSAQNAQALWKVERDRILGDAKASKGTKGTAAQADLERLGPEPSAPPSTDRTNTQPSIQGLARQYREGQPALGVFSDEGGMFLGGYAMNAENRQATLAAMNDLWQGQPIKRTLGGEGSISLYGRRLAMHLMVQPGVARTFMADPMTSDTGFLPRFLMCEPTSKVGFRPYALTRGDTGALAAFGERLREILETPQPMDPETRELTPRLLHLNAQAKAILITFADTVEALQAPGGDLSHVTGYASKAAEQACRIAGVLTLWRDMYAREVTAADMADAIALAQFYLAEAARLSDGAKVSAEIERAEALRKWLVERWPEPDILLRDVMHDCPIRALRESPKARAAINLLVQHGWLVPLPPSAMVRGATRKEAWRIVKGGAGT